VGKKRQTKKKKENTNAFRGIVQVKVACCMVVYNLHR
jgi:hypothetical protein